jgi:hypothetical protein
MRLIKTILLAILLPILLTACASGDSNVRIGIGMGSFGSNGGMSVSGSTEVPVGGGNQDPPLPIQQMPLSDAVIASAFPERDLPFTASEDDIETLSKYVDSDAQPALDQDSKNKLDKCVAREADCRIRLPL